MKTHKMKTLLLLVASYVVIELLTIPYVSIYRLRTENPKGTALMAQRIAEAKQDGKRLNVRQHWIALRRLPRYLREAVVVAEDGAFYSHAGIDWFEVGESFERNLTEGRFARGASTITQQLAKNLYLSTSKTPTRKLKEVVITFLMENILTKDRILEIYINVIEWGRGVYGVEAASRVHFGKSSTSLSLDEATRLAAVIPSPLRHRPNEDSKYVLRQQGIVLRRMEQRRLIESSSDVVDEDADSNASEEDGGPPVQENEE